MSLSATAARGSAQTVAAQMFRLGLQMIAIVVLARLLTPRDYALVAMVTAVIGLADLLRDGGLSTAAMQAPSLRLGQRTNLFWANTALGTITTLLVVAATPLLVRLYHQEALYAIAPAMACVFLLSGMNTQYRVSLARELRFGTLAMSDVIGQAAGFVVALVLAVLGARYWALVAQQLTVAFTMFAVNLVNCRWLPGWPRRDASIRDFFRFGFKVFASDALNYGAQSVDQVLLGATQPPQVLGVYNRAAQIVVTPLTQVNWPLGRIAIPMLSRAQYDDEQFERAAGKAQLVGSYVTASVLAVVAGLAGPITALLLGRSWSAVAPILAVLAVGGVFRSVAHLNQWLFLSRGRPGAQLKLDLWTKPLMVAIIVAGLPWGAIGVATAGVAAWAGYWVVGVVVVARVVRVSARRLFSRAALAMTFVGLPAGVAAHYGAGLVSGTILQVLVGLAAAAAAGATSLAVPPVRRDLTELAGLVHHAVRRPGRRRDGSTAGG